MVYPLSEFNEFLHPEPYPESVIQSIVSRQRAYRTAGRGSVSPLMPDGTWDDVNKRTLHLSDVPQSAQLAELREKAKSKWWGPQGLSFEGEPRALIEPYFITRRASLKTHKLHELITPTARLLINRWLSSVTVTPSIVWGSTQPRNVYARLRRNVKSNTGFHYFTTSDSRGHCTLAEAMKRAEHYDVLRIDPIVAWYRSMRNDFRGIFGSSLTHSAAYYRSGLGYILHDALYGLPGVAYCPFQDIALAVTEFSRAHSHNVTSVEFDWTKVDQHIGEDLALEVTSDVLHVWGLDEADPALVRCILQCLSAHFHLPILDLDGNVLIEDSLALLSGINPTNGLENYINMYTILTAVGRLVDLGGYKLPHFMPWVMGDDSACLVANSADHDEAFMLALVESFMEVSRSLGLEINIIKQRVSTDTMCFCKRYYPLRPCRGWKMEVVRGRSNTPVSAYPCELAWNSILHPEDGVDTRGPAYECKYGEIHGAEIQRILQILDNAYGDARWRSCAAKLAELGLTSSVVRSALSVEYAQRANWRVRVYGAERWSALTSPTAGYLLARK